MNRQDAKTDLGGPVCPICGEPVPQAENQTFPFCSERCRTIDLGNWLGESYRIPTKEPASDDDREDSSH